MDDYLGFNCNNYGDGYYLFYGCGINGCPNGNGWYDYYYQDYDYQDETNSQQVELYK